MSTNSNCLFVQVKPTQWFYVLEQYHAPKNAWDWMEYADAYGPFPTQESANDHLARNHANPGGAEIQELPPGVVEFDFKNEPVLKKLIEEAPKNTRR